MELIKTLEEQILSESRLDDAINKHKNDWVAKYGDTPESIELFEKLVNKLADKDPSNNNKYTEWMTSQIVKDKTLLDEIITAIQGFEKIQPKLSGNYGTAIIRDSLTPSGQSSPIPDNYIKAILRAPKMIDNYPDVATLKIVVDHAETIPSRKQIKEMAKTESIPVYENNRYEIILPKTHRASCHWGRGTAWCTKIKDNPEWFNNYSANSYLFYIIDKHDKENVENPMFKLCVRWYKQDKSDKKHEVWNSFDDQLGNKLEKFFPQDMIDGMQNFIEKQNFAYNLIDTDFISQFIDFDKGPEGFTYEGESIFVSGFHQAQLTIKVHSVKNLIIGEFNVWNGSSDITFSKQHDFDASIMSILIKTANFDNKSFNITKPEVKKMIKEYIKKVVFEIIEDKKNDLYIIGAVRQIHTDIEQDNNKMKGNFNGDWRYNNVELVDNNTILMNVIWPEDPDDDKLKINFYLHFYDIDNAIFEMEGILNENTNHEQRYDKDSDIINLTEYFTSGEKPDIDGLIQDFKSWGIKKMEECLDG